MAHPKKLLAVSLSLSAMLLATNARAQTDIYGRCAEAINDGNGELVREIANTMQRFNQHPVNKIESAEACVSEAVGSPVRLDRVTGDFLDLEEYEAMIEAKREAGEANRIAQEAAQSERMQERSLVRSRMATNQQLISSGIYNSCTALFENNPIAAMTNETCINSFQANGHPDHPNLELYQADQN